MNNPSSRPLERLGIAAMLVFIVSPIVVQGMWCPMARLLHTTANALGLTFAALGVAAVAWFVHAARWHRGKPWYPAASASIAALLFGVGLGSGPAGIVVATLALLAVAVFSGALLSWILPRLPAELDGLACRRKGTTAWVVILGLVAIVQTSRISTFMADPKRVDLSLIPTVPFIVNHSCFTAYIEAARLTKEDAPNIYDAENWPDLSHSERSATYQQRYAPFTLDAFAYPPPFLLLPRLLLPFNDFLAQRSVWFALNGLFVAAGLWLVAAWIDGPKRVRVLLLAPLVLISLPVLLTLQVGNIHTTVMILAVLSMIAFESKRPALGGAMLAFAITSKISPGLLVIVLLVQRRYREVLWTAGFGFGFVLLSLLVLGTAPFEAFVTYQLPLLSSGKALSFLADEASVPLNLGPFGIPFKLAFLGVSVDEPWKLAKIINQAFTLLVVVMTVFAARKERALPEERAAMWMAILTLGALRSPLAPGYIAFTVIWLLSVFTTQIRNIRATVLVSLVGLFFLLPTPFPPRPLAVFTFVQQAVMTALLTYFLFRRGVQEASIVDATRS